MAERVEPEVTVGSSGSPVPTATRSSRTVSQARSFENASVVRRLDKSTKKYHQLCRAKAISRSRKQSGQKKVTALVMENP